MAEKAIVYIKQSGESSVPVTVRMEWLPDGKIMPLTYWTPDGSCYQIRHIIEMTPLAFLKDRGVGLRYKVRSVVTETPDDSDYLSTQHEIYLYFADNWFCGKNFIDGRYGHDAKKYIPVTLDVFPDGDYELIYFWVQGKRYMVEKTLEIEPRGSFLAGGVGMWHKVEARLINANDDEDPDIHKCVRREAAVYFEINKWFVSLKVA